MQQCQRCNIGPTRRFRGEKRGGDIDITIVVTILIGVLSTDMRRNVLHVETDRLCLTVQAEVQMRIRHPHGQQRNCEHPKQSGEGGMTEHNALSMPDRQPRGTRARPQM